MKLDRTRAVLRWFALAGVGASWSAVAAQAAGATNALNRVELELDAALASAAAAKQDLLTFGLNRIHILNEIRLCGEPLWKYLASAIYILLAFYSSKLLDWLISGQLRRWASRTKSNLDDLFIDVVHGPIKVVSFVILLHIGLRLFTWAAWVQDYLSKGLQIVVACSLTYMALKSVDLLMAYWRARVGLGEDRAFDDQLFPIIRKSIKVFILVVAILLTSQNLGLNITSVLASLSIGGLALGLAAQDTIANLFGAVAIFIDKPFRIGDRVKLESVDGVVETIGLRSTRLRNLEGHLITVPNKTMGGATIINVSRRPNIKTELNIGLTYDTSPAQLERAAAILQEIYRAHPMTADLMIGFNKFADSALNISVTHWWKATDYRAYVQGMHELNLLIKKRFDEEKLNFAFPSQTLYLKQDSQWQIHDSPAHGENKG